MAGSMRPIWRQRETLIAVKRRNKVGHPANHCPRRADTVVSGTGDFRETGVRPVETTDTTPSRPLLICAALETGGARPQITSRSHSHTHTSHTEGPSMDWNNDYTFAGKGARARERERLTLQS